MLHRLAVYARSKHLTMNTAKSEVVLFDSKHGSEEPITIVAEDAIKCFDLFRNLSRNFPPDTKHDSIV